MDKTETIYFDESEHWEFKTYLTIGQERKWVQHAIDAQATIQDNSSELIESLARRMDQLVVDQTVAWSFGSVDLDTFYTIPSYHYAEVADRMGDLYSPLVVKCIERGLQLYTSLSSQVVEQQSQQTS